MAEKMELYCDACDRNIGEDAVPFVVRISIGTTRAEEVDIRDYMDELPEFMRALFALGNNGVPTRLDLCAHCGRNLLSVDKKLVRGMTLKIPPAQQRKFRLDDGKRLRAMRNAVTTDPPGIPIMLPEDTTPALVPVRVRGRKGLALLEAADVEEDA
jgi:nitrite reductase/ring-hydroxylating ferredoxin subunit